MRRMRIIPWINTVTKAPCFTLVMEWFEGDRIIKDGRYQMGDDEFRGLAYSVAESEWQPIETAPKDGSRIMWGGRYKPFDINPGGQWTEVIVSWSTIYSNGTGHQWLGDHLHDPTRYNVEWTHWRKLPPPPYL